MCRMLNFQVRNSDITQLANPCPHYFLSQPHIVQVNVSGQFWSDPIVLDYQCFYFHLWLQQCLCVPQEKVIPCLLRLKQANDPGLRAAVREALSLVGYHKPVKGRGIRILSIDGGGLRFDFSLTHQYQVLSE